MTLIEKLARVLEPNAWEMLTVDPDRLAYLSRRTASLRKVRAVLSALEEAGYVVVPREPTEGMVDAAVTVPPAKNLGERVISQWQAMISAAKADRP